MEIYSYLSIYLPTYKNISHIDYNQIIKITNSGRFYFFILQKRKQSFRVSDLPEATPTNRCQNRDSNPIQLPSEQEILTLPILPLPSPSPGVVHMRAKEGSVASSHRRWEHGSWATQFFPFTWYT